MDKNNKTRLTVLLITFNHINSIEKALNSVLSQKTNFAFKLHIHDDCSTDGTSEIIQNYVKKYPDKVFHFQNEKNIGGMENMYSALKGVDTEYFAYLDTDDYWCDETKLQKQVDILDKNPDCTFCAHNTNVVDSVNQKEFLQIPESFEEGLYRRNDFLPHTSAITYRNIINFSEIENKSLITWDFTLFWYYIIKGNFYVIQDVMSIYNHNGSGTYSGKNKDRHNYLMSKSFELLIIMLDKFGYENLTYLYSTWGMTKFQKKCLKIFKLLFGNKFSYHLFYNVFYKKYNTDEEKCRN
jgi:glycosyltransferase involved in cell wall biosynthesis